MLDALHKNAADFTLTFRRLGDAAASPDGDAAIRSLFTDPSGYDVWATQKSVARLAKAIVLLLAERDAATFPRYAQTPTCAPSAKPPQLPRARLKRSKD